MMDVSTVSSVPTMPSTPPPHGYRVLHFLSFHSRLCLQWRGLLCCFCCHKQRRVAADINVRAVFIVSAAAVAGHAAGVHVVSTLHPNIARDFQIGIALYRALIRAADHVMQAAVGRRVNITARRGNDMRAGYPSSYNRRRKAFPSDESGRFR